MCVRQRQGRTERDTYLVCSSTEVCFETTPHPCYTPWPLSLWPCAAPPWAGRNPKRNMDIERPASRTSQHTYQPPGRERWVEGLERQHGTFLKMLFFTSIYCIHKHVKLLCRERSELWVPKVSRFHCGLPTSPGATYAPLSSTPAYPGTATSWHHVVWGRSEVSAPKIKTSRVQCRQKALNRPWIFQHNVILECSSTYKPGICVKMLNRWYIPHWFNSRWLIRYPHVFSYMALNNNYQ